MLSKIKKVLVSLALASSLAIAPMNVSANDYNGPIKGSASADPAVNESNETVKVPAYLTGTASVTPEYTVEVSPTITINLDDKSTSALDLADSPKDGAAGIYIKLTGADDFDGKNLKVTPKFAILDTETEIQFSAKDASDNTITTETGKKLSELGVTNDLLKFGTYTNNLLNTGTNIASFAEANLNTPSAVPACIDPTLADAIRKNIPDEIEDSNGTKSASKPQIAENQQIGNVTFDCEFSS